MAAPTDSPNPPSRGIFSSIVGNMRRGKRSKNFTEFVIEPLEGVANAYLSGSPVTGHIRFSVAKSISVTHLAIYLHGFVDVRGSSSNDLPDVQPSVAHDVSSRAGKQHAKGGIVYLFERETILCNGGLLQPSNYLFKFNLQFPDDRSHCLPSSLNFERGSITYLLTARLTLPDNTVHSTNHPLRFIQRVDVALMKPPKPLALYVEPWSKRRKKKSIPPPPGGASTNAVFDTVPEPVFDLVRSHEFDGLIRRVDVSYDDASPVEHVAHIGHAKPRLPISDRRSEVSMSRKSSFSVASAAARSTRSLDPSIWTSTLARVDSINGNGNEGSNTITGEFELRKGGWLPGETIPIYCHIQHVKHLQTPRGIFVTLYREGRIDTSRPAAGHGTASVVSDDSWAALSSLSLSSNGSVSRFKKELCQNFTPVYLDSETLTADVVPKVKVPTEAFPTVEKLPGDVLSFIYYAEILLDLDGRMSSQLQNAAQKSGSRSNPFDSDKLDPWMYNFWDTEHLRRIKGTVSITLPIVVGSIDSSKRGRFPTQRTLMEYSGYQDSQRYHDLNTPSRGSWEEINWPAADDPTLLRDRAFQQQQQQSQQGPPLPPNGHQHVSFSQTIPAETTILGLSYQPPRIYCQPPSYLETSPLDQPQPRAEGFGNEKERLRSHEGTSMPSRPPGAFTEPSSSVPTLAGPSVPVEASASAHPLPSAPVLESVEESNREDGQPHGEKQELERQRLMVESTVPNEGTSQEHSSYATWAADVLASAPFMEDDHNSEESNHWANRSPHPEPLPRYER
ncbi:hypothetical protein MKZ38_006457 [Zalerion maritima]|uniref:Arrestin-like N-terminal domain-containing protein n=1 Tax=Zalerion maritima TaxID=339359 RepID=A0AAD5WVU6_9PEZI|nr:hypothetical protein MKZ38_006457 [Zalerion maritima]